jgi:hypothetical protein
VGADRERSGRDAVRVAVMRERSESVLREVATSCATHDSAAVATTNDISTQAVVAQALMQ